MVKTLTVTEEAYTRLAARKKPGDSFSDVIVNLTGKSSILDLAGVLPKEEGEKLRNRIREGRKEMRERVERIRRRLDDTGH